MSPRDRLGARAGRLLAGSGEPIFRLLPERVLANLRRRGSENALVWNLMYPLAHSGLSLHRWLAIRPLWGTAGTQGPDEILWPYFWGWSVDGRRLEALDDCLDRLDGPGLQTEVDLFLLGASTLVLIEAKHLAAAGRCGRYLRRRCPEIHPEALDTGETCRYWTQPGAQFSLALEFGPRPMAGGQAPPCARHYQLGRTLLLGLLLSERLGRTLHVWLVLPRRRWRGMETAWLDFTERVRDADLWRHMRVLAWEDVAALPRPRETARGNHTSTYSR
ncbi:MAG: hypothetical protein AB1449_12545 [Chloroflexota bacterium]